MDASPKKVPEYNPECKENKTYINVKLREVFYETRDVKGCAAVKTALHVAEDATASLEGLSVTPGLAIPILVPLSSHWDHECKQLAQSHYTAAF